MGLNAKRSEKIEDSPQETGETSNRHQMARRNINKKIIQSYQNKAIANHNY